MKIRNLNNNIIDANVYNEKGNNPDWLLRPINFFYFIKSQITLYSEQLGLEAAIL